MGFFKCYIEDCMLPALLKDDCFAYCSREHKGQVVMLDYDSEKQKPRNKKEMQLKLKRMGEEAKQRELQNKGRLFE